LEKNGGDSGEGVSLGGSVPSEEGVENQLMRGVLPAADTEEVEDSPLRKEMDVGSPAG